MGLFRRQKQQETAPVQMRLWERHPFGLMGGYVPLGNNEIGLYREIREAGPNCGRGDYKAHSAYRGLYGGMRRRRRRDRAPAVFEKCKHRPGTAGNKLIY